MDAAVRNAEVGSTERPAKRQKLDVASGPAATNAAFLAEDETATERLKGITAYIQPSSTSFSGVLKQRYSDFLVNEIDQTGKTVFLHQSGSNGGNSNGATSLSFSHIVPQTRSAGGSRGGRYNSNKGKMQLHFTLYKENRDTMDVLQELARQANMRTDSFGFAGTKDKRAITTQRVSVAGVKTQRLVAAAKGLRQARVGDFENKNTGLGLGDLCGNYFEITLRDCQFPGTEEHSLDERREIAEKIVQERVTAFAKDGFINYFGLQRFGSQTTGTEKVGMQMLAGDYKSAVNSILEYSPEALAASRNDEGSEKIASDEKQRASAIHDYERSTAETCDVQAILNGLPRRYTAERCILRSLADDRTESGKEPTQANYLNALKGIPRNLRTLYVHAYQSLVWNTAASDRWTRFGSRVVEGDLILSHEHEKKETTAVTNKEPELDEDGDPIIAPEAQDRSAIQDDFERAVPLTKEQAQSGQYTIFDIVLPLPGFDVEYPRNGVGEMYKTFMGSETGGKLDPHNMRRSWKDVSLSGAYRKIVTKVGLENIAWEAKTYTASNEQLSSEDIKRYKAKSTKPGTDDAVNETSPEARTQDETDRTNDSTAESDTQPMTAEVQDTDKPPNADEPQKLAFVVKFPLLTSQYATMALRELLGPGGVKHFRSEYYSGRH